MSAMTSSLGLSRRWRVVAAASIGNALEWFDFVVYGFFAVTMARLFFPTGNETVSILLALGTFGVPFFMRPLGAIVFGSFADRHGRKAAFTLTIIVMMIGTAIIAFTPTYSTIGISPRSWSCSPACCRDFRPVASSAAPPLSWRSRTRNAAASTRAGSSRARD